MSSALEQIREIASRLRLDDSLLFLNHALAVSRGWSDDAELRHRLETLSAPLPAFVVHFFAKQFLLHGSELGPRQLDWATFERLYRLYFEIDDPIVGDPNWPQGDPTGFFERLFAQQMPSQHRNFLQYYGLALGLFRDAGAPQSLGDYDLRQDLESALGVSIADCMRMGHLCFSARLASNQGHTFLGTFNHGYLAEASASGLRFAVPENWQPFLDRVSCSRDAFRVAAHQPAYVVGDERFTQYEFNPLLRFPLIELSGGRFLAPDPDLMLKRVTLGLFYDLFERDGVKFSERFGDVLDRFVGDLLKSVCPLESLWSGLAWEATHGKNSRGKIGDWVYVGESANVLIECKSLRPSLALTQFGSESGVKDFVCRVAKALKQLTGHNDSIQKGGWLDAHISPQPPIGVLVTYGRLQTVNAPFVRRQIVKELGNAAVEFPFVVLSLEEFDVAIRLVECGHPLDEVMLTLAMQKDRFDVLQHYRSELAERALSAATYRRAKGFLDTLTDVARGPG